jgi:D-3-phosphoglycerate dehydrogenase
VKVPGPIRIVSTEIPETSERDLSLEREHLPAGSEICQFTYKGDSGALIEACKGADAILTAFVPFRRDVIQELNRCRIISVTATGWDCIDVEAAADNGISVCCIGEYCTNEVADHTLAFLLALNRKLMEYDRQVQMQKRWQWDAISGLKRLSGQTLGIVGLGRIGRNVARRARSFGLNVVACDPFVESEEAARLGFRLVDLDELLARSDIISLHCNLTDDNQRLLDRDAFKKMRQRPIIINVARGGLINEAHLVEALDAGWISGAALDVLTNESPDLAGSGLTGRSNVILTPHVAFYSDASILDCRRISALNISNFFAGNHAAVFKFVHHAQNE